jgi:glycosyltransferase involved in cell wall biosynthesis
MKILQVGKYFPPAPGGIERTSFLMSEHFTARGHRTDVLCFNSSPRSVVENQNGYTIFRAGIAGVLASQPLSLKYFLLFKKIRNNYDIIHFHSPNPLASLALFLFRPKAPVILFWHTDIYKQKLILFFYKPLLKWLVKYSRIIMGHTEAHLDHSDFSALFTGKSVVNHFTFYPEKRSAGRDEERIMTIKEGCHNKKIVFALGRLVYYKGFSYLVEAAQYLPEEYCVVIGGSGPLSDDLRQQVENLGLNNKVILPGRIDDEELQSWYESARVFVISSIVKTEMLGLVQLDAMYYGVPVVSTDIPGSGVPLVNRHGITGLVVPPEDPRALAEAVMAIDADERKYSAMSTAAVEHILSSFSAQSTVDSYLATAFPLLK